MGLLDKLTTGQSNLTGLNGSTPEIAEFSTSKYGAFKFKDRP